MDGMTRCNHYPKPSQGVGLGQCTLEFGHAGEHRWEDQISRENQCVPYHDYKEYIDPQSGGFMRCTRCGKEVDCEGTD